MRRALVVGALGGLAVCATIVLLRGRRESLARCGEGFVARGTRCIGEGEAPRPIRIAIPETTLSIGPSDWEAQGRVAPRVAKVPAFMIDAFELTVAEREGAPSADGARAASDVTYDEAEKLCAARGGLLPTDDQWMAAAAGERMTRYPWGDTGAVCRRAAWGLATGPCASGATGPDTVGAHPDGRTERGVHDLAGNVAEWIMAPSASSVAAVRGGSFRTELASDLRTWSRRELPKSTRADDVGVRCVYPSQANDD